MRRRIAQTSRRSGHAASIPPNPAPRRQSHDDDNDANHAPGGPVNHGRAVRCRAHRNGRAGTSGAGGGGSGGRGAAGPRPGGLERSPAHPTQDAGNGHGLRSERLFRQVRAEMQELRSSFSNLQVAGEELSELDIAAVVANPDAAALLPPALLVRALIRSNESSEKLLRKLARARARSERLDAKLRDLRQERAFTRGRTETLDQVIAALHGNLEDLRATRDSNLRTLGEPSAPRVLRGAAMAPAHDALPPPERA